MDGGDDLNIEIELDDASFDMKNVVKGLKKRQEPSAQENNVRKNIKKAHDATKTVKQYQKALRRSQEITYQMTKLIAENKELHEQATLKDRKIIQQMAEIAALKKKLGAKQPRLKIKNEKNKDIKEKLTISKDNERRQEIKLENNGDADTRHTFG